MWDFLSKLVEALPAWFLVALITALLAEAMKAAKSSGAKSNLAFQMQGMDTQKCGTLRAA
jgi:hypothetical protein